MARQPQGLWIRLLKWLLCSFLGVFCGVSGWAMGWEIDIDGPPALGVLVGSEAGAAAPQMLPAEALLERARTSAWHQGLLEILSHQGASRQVLRAPVPSAEAICASLETVLPYFDLAAGYLPEHLRQRLCRRIRTYSVRHRRDVQAMLYRADGYLPMIKRKLREYGLPTYYAYVPLVESAFQADAMHSRSGARGLWQLVRHTARARGLTVTEAVDERLHPRLSTEAAVNYLAHLTKRFGAHGPLYVLAAYNHGETNLSRKMRRARTHDIAWLFRPGHVPGETREYLLRMMTMWVIAAHPGRYHMLLREAADRPVLPPDAAPRIDTLVGVAESGGAKE